MKKKTSVWSDIVPRGPISPSPVAVSLLAYTPCFSPLPDMVHLIVPRWMHDKSTHIWSVPEQRSSHRSNRIERMYESNYLSGSLGRRSVRLVCRQVSLHSIHADHIYSQKWKIREEKVWSNQTDITSTPERFR